MEKYVSFDLLQKKCFSNIEKHSDLLLGKVTVEV